MSDGVKPVLVTGGAGFVGRHLCKRLLAEGERVAETLFFDYWRTRRTRIKVARIFNTYGPRMDPADDPRVRQPVMEKARELLGWKPPVALSEGLDRTIEFFSAKLPTAG